MGLSDLRVCLDQNYGNWKVRVIGFGDGEGGLGGDLGYGFEF